MVESGQKLNTNEMNVHQSFLFYFNRGHIKWWKFKGKAHFWGGGGVGDHKTEENVYK